MPPTETPSPSSNPRRRIIWLIVAHVIVGWIAATLVVTAAFNFDWTTIALFIVFGQTTLVGIWAGLSKNSWWSRLLGFAASVGYLGTLYGISLAMTTGEVAAEEVLQVAFVVFLATVTATVIFLVVRCFRVRLHHVSDEVTVVTKLQFSTRSLLILTFVVACLVTLGKWLRPYVPDWPYFDLANVAGWLVALAPFPATGLVSVWLILGTRHPLLWSVLLVVGAVAVGYCLFHPILTTPQAVVLVASLVVVRSCGYRLVRLRSSCT